MKKNVIAVVAMTVAASLMVGCGAASSTDTKADAQTAVYNMYNTTGETISELYVYEVGSEDKGENYAAEGLANGAQVEVTRTAASEEEAASLVYVLEFTTESGATQKFETLNFEVAPVSLRSVDAAAGATPVQFEIPEMKAVYNVVNTTGETVTELYLYEAGSEDKGENKAADGLAADASVVLTETEAADVASSKVYVLEFTTESGATQKFERVNFEEANVELLSVDAAAGATPIVFGVLAK